MPDREHTQKRCRETNREMPKLNRGTLEETNRNTPRSWRDGWSRGHGRSGGLLKLLGVVPASLARQQHQPAQLHNHKVRRATPGSMCRQTRPVVISASATSSAQTRRPGQAGSTTQVRGGTSTRSCGRTHRTAVALGTKLAPTGLGERPSAEPSGTDAIRWISARSQFRSEPRSHLSNALPNPVVDNPGR